MIVTICVGSSCHLKGSYEVINELKRLIKEYELGDKIELKADFCMGNCINAVSVKVNDSKCLSITPQKVEKFFMEYILEGVKNECN